MFFPEPSKAETAVFVGVVVTVLGTAGYGAGKLIEWLWPLVKAGIAAAVAAA